MEEVNIVLERHDQHIKSLQHQLDDIKEVQREIKVMNGTLIELTAELKHTNEHLSRNEADINEIKAQPYLRLAQIKTAIISAISSGIIGAIIGAVVANK